MSDEDPKPPEERPALTGNQDQSAEAEEGDSTENVNPSIEEEGTPTGEEGLSTENGNPSIEEESTPTGEEGLSTENGNASVEDESTPVADEFSSLEDESTLTVVETPTVEEKHPTVKKQDSTPKEERSAEEEHTTVKKGDSTPEEEHSAEEEHATVKKQDSSPEEKSSSIEEENAAVKKQDSTPEEESSSIEVEKAAVKKEDSTPEESSSIEVENAGVKKEDSTPEEERSAEEENATADKGCSPIEEKMLQQGKECQTAEEVLTYVEPKCIIKEYIPTKIPSVDDEFFDRSIQTTLKADPIDREIQTTLKLERSISTSSLNASMGDDSASSLKECPSIEEEPEPEPVVTEILRLKAQVMIRNDSTGGWVPEGCGGMSSVKVYKVTYPTKPGVKRQADYIVRGRRHPNKKDNIYCYILEDLEYNKVMPTFHHWQTGEKRYGLTFQMAVEARAFSKCLQAAVFDRMRTLDPNAVPKRFEGDDDDDFLAFTKPAEPRPRTPSPEVVYDLPDYLKPNYEEEERIQFMQLTSLPEYYYQDFRANEQPKAEEKLRRRPYRRTRKPLRLFGLIRRTTRLRCKYCHELYEEEENKRGKCRYAPNKAKAVIDDVSCMRCAKWFVRACMMDPDEDFAHPCTCGDDGYCGMRWVGLCVLSFLIPCILLYPPMTACYHCGVRCGTCGERHEPKPSGRDDQRIDY